MITKELVEFIEASRAAGKLPQEIKRDLISAGGWTEADVNEVFRVLDIQDIARAPIPTPAAPVAPLQQAPVSQMNPGPVATEQNKGGKMGIIITIIILLLVIGGVLYALKTGILPLPESLKNLF